MLWKSLTIACLLILNVAGTARSIERPPTKRPNVFPPAASANRLTEKLEAAEETENYPEIERLARQILRQDPNNRIAINSLGRSLKARSKFAQAESLYRQQIAKHRLDFSLYRELGEILLAQNKSEAALALYRQAVALNPPNSYLDPYEIDRALFDVLIKLDRTDEAIAFGKQRLAVSSNQIEILDFGLRLSNLLKQQGKIDEAIAILRQTIAKAPGEETLYTQLGQLLIEQGKETEAIDLYQQAIVLPKNSLSTFNISNSIYLALGDLLEKQHRAPEAIVVYRKLIANSRFMFSQVISQQPDLISQLEKTAEDSEYLSSVFNQFSPLGAQIKINELLYQQQGWSAVQTEMQPIAQTTPEIAAYILRSFGERRVASRQPNDAILAYQQAIELDKIANNARTQGNLFLAFTLADRPDRAKAAYQAALAKTPAAKRQEAIKNWALALDKAGRQPAAIDLYRQFLKSPGKEYVFISLQLAHALEQNGQPAAATPIYQQVQVALTKLQRSAPKDPNTFTMQGNLFAQRQQPQAAIENYRKAIALLTAQGDKKDGKLLSFNHLKLADNLRLTGKQPEAIEFYRQAIQGCDCTAIKLYQPSTLHGMAYHGLGLSLELQGQIPAAKAAFQKALAIDPSYEEAQISLIRINRNPR